MDLDDAGREEGPLTDLLGLLGKNGVDANGIVVREHPSGVWGIHAPRNLSVG